MTAKKVIRALKASGFVEDRQKGSHLILIHPETRARTGVESFAENRSRVEVAKFESGRETHRSRASTGQSELTMCPQSRGCPAKCRASSFLFWFL